MKYENPVLNTLYWYILVLKNRLGNVGELAQKPQKPQRQVNILTLLARQKQSSEHYLKSTQETRRAADMLKSKLIDLQQAWTRPKKKGNEPWH